MTLTLRRLRPGVDDELRSEETVEAESISPRRDWAWGRFQTVAAGSASRYRNVGGGALATRFRGLAFTHARPGQSGIVVAPNNP